MATMAVDNAFRERLEHVEGLIRDMERTADPATRARTQEIVQALLDYHGAGLGRILEHLGDAGQAGETVLDRLSKDDLVSSMLLLYDLHPLGMEARVRQALERVRPYLKSHGGGAELLGIHDGIVELRLQGSGHSCGSSSATVKQTLEEIILAAAPEVTRVEIEDRTAPAAPTSAFISVDDLLLKPSPKNGNHAQAAKA